MLYLDNAATSFPKPECVTQEVMHFLTKVGANPGRSANSSSITSARILFDVRKSLSSFVGQKDIFRTIFTLNATMAINSCLYGFLKENDTVLITSLEHNALIRPLKELERTRNIKIRVIPSTTTCKLDLKAAKELAVGCKMIACTHANNVTGAILPLELLSSLAKESGSYFLVDASQSVGIVEIDMDKLGIDFLCASAHKGLLAPMGLGYFCFSSRVSIDEFNSFYQGGTGSRSEEITQPELLPDKYESGTINMPSIAGLGKSLKWIEEIGLNTIYNHENELRALIYEGLKKIPNLRVCEVDPLLNTTGVLSFYIESKSLSESAMLLNDKYGILTRVGLHCSPLTHKSIGTFDSGGSIRVSPSFFTTSGDVEYLINAINEISIK